MTEIKMIVSDLDGTLLNEEHILSKKTGENNSVHTEDHRISEK